MLSTVAKYWPAIGAGVYVVYAALWDPAVLSQALAAFAVAAGLNVKTAAAHDKIAQLSD